MKSRSDGNSLYFKGGKEEEEKKLANGAKVPDAIPAEKESGQGSVMASRFPDG